MAPIRNHRALFPLFNLFFFCNSSFFPQGFFVSIIYCFCNSEVSGFCLISVTRHRWFQTTHKEKFRAEELTLTTPAENYILEILLCSYFLIWVLKLLYFKYTIYIYLYSVYIYILGLHH